MRFPYSWLREYLDTDLDPEQIAAGLDKRGFKLEAMEQVGNAYPGVVVARVLEVEKHPDADRLSLCRVDGGGEAVRVVCGATNVRPGMIAPFATVGAKLPGGMVIKRATIRGQESQGMLCSARELGLSDDHEGIVALPDLVGADTPLVPGTPLDAVLGGPETVLDVEVFYNRGDAQSILGLVREVAAFAGAKWTEDGIRRLNLPWKASGGFDLAIDDTEGCPRYLAQVLENVTVGPSPRWAVRRLEAMGVRAINNVVDATQLVMFEYGQPLHAFDLERLAGPSIRVRRARQGESLRTLDGKTRALDPEVLVIGDGERAVALAGIMGGEDTEVRGGTKRLLLECAAFDPQRVRRGVVRLGLKTEASRRFERGVDPQVAPTALARFLELMREFCPDARAGASAEQGGPGRRVVPVRMRTERCDALLGLAIPVPDQARLLRTLGFSVVEQADTLVVTPPSWRRDVQIEEDVIEEVARAHGYDAIPEPMPELGGATAHRSSREREIAAARRAFLARGFDEALCTSLVSEEEARAAAGLGGDDDGSILRLANPMSRESAALRPNPIPGLLRAVAHNLRQGAESVRLFEVGAGYRALPPRAKEERPVDEPLYMAAAVAGKRLAHAHDDTQAPVDFFDAKGVWEAVLEELRVDTPEWRAYSGPGWKPGASAQVASRGSRIGWAGVAAPRWLDTWDIDVPVYLGLVRLDTLFLRGPAAPLRLPGRFPPVRRDVAFFVPSSVPYADVERVLKREGGDWLRGLELFDVYSGTGTPDGMRSLAFALQFGHEERTLTESEVEAIQQRMAAGVARECGGRLREK